MPAPPRPARCSRTSSRLLGVTITPEIAEPLYTALVTDTGRFQYANTTPKALRLAADLVEAGADVHKVFQGVYESVQFAKLKLLARALERAQVYEGGTARRLVPAARDDFAEVGAAEPYSEGIIDYLRAVEGRGHGRADPGAAARRLRRPGGSRCAPRWTSWTSRRSRARPAAAVIGRPPASRATTRSRITPSSSASSPPSVVTVDALGAMPPPRALEPAGIILVDKPAGPVVVRDRQRASGAGSGRARGTPARSTRSRPGCCVLLSGRATKVAPRFVGLDKRYLTEIDLSARTSTGDPEGEVVEELEPPEPEELERRLTPLRGEVELRDPGGVGGQDRAASAPTSCTGAGWRWRCRMRRSRVDALELLGYEDGVATLDLTVELRHVRALDRGGARRALPRAAADGGRPVRRRRGGRGAR